MIVALLLLIINIWIFITTRQPQKLKEIREKYKILREHIKTVEDEKFNKIKNEIPLVAFKRIGGPVGYNTNKGQEIGICLKGDVNEIFHVLLHELAHSTVKEYSHSKQYWKNFKELREMATSLGIYDEIPDRTAFCGRHIQDK